jgi:2-(1,2-epoxy-1,2-dihydrophenyl)acetyl-CoA isomerase
MNTIRMERHDGVGIIEIARRGNFNSLDVESAQDLRKAGLQMARDRMVQVVILHGQGGVFCSGADLKYIRNGGQESELSYLRPEDREPGHGPAFKQILEYLHSTISEIRRAPKPFIAMVDGPAAAGGFGLAMACDLVLASERSWFEWAYFKTGLTGAESSTFMLPRLLGFRRAMELVLLSPRVTAQQALDLGLINRVYPDALLETETLALARQLATRPAAAVAVAKRLINSAAGMDRLDTHLDLELDELARAASGAEVAEGMEAFFAKRTPEFKGH